MDHGYGCNFSKIVNCGRSRQISVGVSVGVQGVDRFLQDRLMAQHLNAFSAALVIRLMLDQTSQGQGKEARKSRFSADKCKLAQFAFVSWGTNFGKMRALR
jgi:hypothetical protein